MKALLCMFLVSLAPMCAYALSRPAPVDEYPIHADGGLVYDPLHREAEKTGQLARYAKCETRAGEIVLGRCRLSYQVPAKTAAYDVVPITYQLAFDDSAGAFPVAVEATAFEDESRRNGRDLHDLCLPGKIDLQVEYLGSITAQLIPGRRHNLKPDMSDTPGEYPGFERKPQVRSGVVEAGDLVWFRFRFKNTGNTILDAEGMGGCQIFPELSRKDEKGEWQFAGHPYNLYVRDLEYLYPGESHEAWVHFQAENRKETPQGFGLTPGEYKIIFRMVYRGYKGADPFVNIWEGPQMFAYEQPVTVEKDARQAPVPEGKVTLTDGDEPDKITRWIHTFEEFMTAFDCHISSPASRGVINGTLHLQLAPWTKQVVLKLISTGPVAIKTAAVPIDVDSESLSVTFKPDHQVTTTSPLTKGGLRGVGEPVIYSQSMADMRTNVQHGPFPERHIRERLEEMMDCGVNVVATTGMPWLYHDFDNPKSNYQGDAWKYFLDLARFEGIQVEGWGQYPYDRSTIGPIASRILGRDVGLRKEEQASGMTISHCDPNLPAANAAAWLYQFHRWGDLYYQMAGGEAPIGVEDTRGWMRQDVNVRHPMGKLTVRAFRDWVKAKYGTIEAANASWGTSYASFDEIEPEKNQVRNQHGHLWEYTDPKHPFHDWNQAVEDLDRFRTEVRVKNYKDTLALVRKEIPEAKIILRTEGGNVLVSGIDPTSPNTHLRHIYHSQRRCGAIADIIQKSGTVRLHSDYTTMPYTPSELRELVRKSVEQGIIPAYLPQFDNMRDIAINARYGTDFQTHYNLPEPRKGMMMHVLTAVYPWFKAVYEEGGVPGILWEDYQCDGFATETQKREMRFFHAKLQESMNKPEAKKAATNAKQPSQEWRKGSKAMRSYRGL